MHINCNSFEYLRARIRKIRRLTALIKDGDIPELLEIRPDRGGKTNVALQFARLENSSQISIYPIDVTAENGDAHRIRKIPTDNLSVSASVRNFLDSVQFRVHPINIVRSKINRQITRCADTGCYDRRPVATIEECLAYSRILSIIDPVQVSFDWIHGQLSRRISSRLHENFSMGAIQPTDLYIIIMRKDIGEI